MAFHEHRFSFAGRKVRDYAGGALPDPAQFAARVRVGYDDKQTWLEKFEAVLNAPNAAELTSLVVGAWDGEGLFEAGSQGVLEALVAARSRLPALTALFLGDIIGEECEVSWLHQCDVSPLFTAYPGLEHFAVRGSTDLAFGRLEHERLKSLVVQSGGLDVGIVRDLLSASLPGLEHLELYLGTDNYGANTEPEDLAPLLRGELFPKLTSLGLRDSDIADALAGVLANAPVLARLKVLDLSLGTLGDEGARALMTSGLLGGLEKIDIHHHFVSREVLAEFKALLRRLKVKVDASDPQEDDGDWRFVAIGE